MDINKLKQIKQILNMNKAAQPANSANNAAESAPFNAYLEKALDGQNMKNNQLGSLVASLSDLTKMNAEKAGAVFAQAMLEDEVSRKKKIQNNIYESDTRVSPIKDKLNNFQDYKNNNNIQFVNEPSQINHSSRNISRDENLIAQALPNKSQQVQQNLTPKNDNYSLNILRDENLIAQALPNEPQQVQQNLTPENVNTEGLKTNKLDVTPFQLFMDKAVEALEGLSTMEIRVNDLIEQYIQGKVSIEEVSTETAKLSMAISFATTVITQITTTFKEIQNLPV
jgi:hypothetical protein